MSLERNPALVAPSSEIERFLLMRSLEELQVDRKILNRQWWSTLIASGLGGVSIVASMAAFVFAWSIREDCDNKEEDCVSSAIKKQPLSTGLLTGSFFTTPCSAGLTFWAVSRHLRISRELKNTENDIRQYSSPRPII